jgi:uncharacterized membrane protein
MLTKLWFAYFQSYWFVPTTMAVGALLVATVTIYVDRTWDVTWPEQARWLLRSQPDGARALLQTIAGSMITVAGVAFSITIASVAQASSQFGPRLLTNFLQDTGNQITLGTFIATFVYCFLVLRTVQGVDGGDMNTRFVPDISILVAMTLALASLSVLIYFFHHMPESLHVSHMIASSGTQLHTRLNEIYPTRIGEESDAPSPSEEAYVAAGALEDAAPVPSETIGYVQNIDAATLLAAAKRHDITVWSAAGPGSFVGHGAPLAYVKPAGLVDNGVITAMQAAFIVGRKRTPAQDVLFLVNQLVEVAGRALSPGINDPLTATTCVNWLGSAVIALCGREVPGSCRYDDDGRLRVVAPPVSFEAFADAVFGQLRPYVETDRNAAVHMMRVLADIAPHVQSTDRARVIARHAASLNEGCRSCLGHPDDRAAVEAQHEVLQTLLRHWLQSAAGPHPERLTGSTAKLP